MADSPTVLVVDDSELVRVMLRELLTLKGYAVVTAPDGEEAMSLANGQQIDAAFTDLQLPGQSGIELCRGLRALGENRGRRFPIWVMSGSDLRDHSAEACAAGAEGFFRKPFRTGEICELLAQAFAPFKRA